MDDEKEVEDKQQDDESKIENNGLCLENIKKELKKKFRDLMKEIDNVTTGCNNLEMNMGRLKEKNTIVKKTLENYENIIKL